MITVEAISGTALTAALDDLARLRIEVFRSFPYLYDGDFDYEAHYLRSYRDTPRGVLVVAKDGNRIVGAATGMPLRDHGDAAQMDTSVLPPVPEIFYFAESVLLPMYRGQGIGHKFFDLREAHARGYGFAHALFCGVTRPASHPMRPAGYRPLDAFWSKRGYAPVPGATAVFHWKDLGQTEETPHTLQCWMNHL